MTGKRGLLKDKRLRFVVGKGNRVVRVSTVLETAVVLPQGRDRDTKRVYGAEVGPFVRRTVLGKGLDSNGRQRNPLRLITSSLSHL